jgi:hypothetical protein
MVRGGVVLVVAAIVGAVLALMGARFIGSHGAAVDAAVEQAHGLDPRAFTLGVEPIR